MKKKYNTPIVVFVLLSSSDIISMSDNVAEDCFFS